ncbi:uncharacterized protein CCOS01_07021 [Colletotrichum costaricense]|uniref:Uncharacterized protein n=1 Tax=Colletotrichum costaricense TaxID=1209916 RepID=A0AAI9YZ66_9PEZI|nr:uncharacterized protein CCOS01_07021 [Colletotrichum costaricense]KAK1529187.1 hypothetical protein CCOS01_07021 [Colletotrichum costaricense]
MSRNVSLTSLADCLCGLICLLVQTVDQVHSWFLANACAQMCLFTAGRGMAQFVMSLLEHVVHSA